MKLASLSKSCTGEQTTSAKKTSWNLFYSTMVIYFPLTNGLQNYIEGKHQSFYNEESWET